VTEAPQKHSAMALALRLGTSIVVPLVVLLLIGRFLDQKMGSSPLYLLIGLGLAFFITMGYLIYASSAVMKSK
jgi:F0F1-type ATP synthase assembly protein I